MWGKGSIQARKLQCKPLNFTESVIGRGVETLRSLDNPNYSTTEHYKVALREHEYKLLINQSFTMLSGYVSFINNSVLPQLCGLVMRH